MTLTNVSRHHTEESKSPINFQRASKHWNQLIEKPDSQLRVAGSADDTDHTALKHYKNNPYSWGTKRGFPTTRSYPLLVEPFDIRTGPSQGRPHLARPGLEGTHLYSIIQCKIPTQITPWF